MTDTGPDPERVCFFRGYFMTLKEVLHILNRYFTLGCSILLLTGGGYSLFVAIMYIDENIVRVFVGCLGVFFVIMGLKYLLEFKKTR